MKDFPDLSGNSESTSNRLPPQVWCLKTGSFSDPARRSDPGRFAATCHISVVPVRAEIEVNRGPILGSARQGTLVIAELSNNLTLFSLSQPFL